MILCHHAILLQVSLEKEVDVIRTQQGKMRDFLVQVINQEFVVAFDCNK